MPITNKLGSTSPPGAKPLLYMFVGKLYQFLIIRCSYTSRFTGEQMAVAHAEATFVCNCLGKISIDTSKRTKIFPWHSSYSFAEIAETRQKKVKLSTYRWYTPASLDHKKSSQNYNVIAASAKCQQGLRRENDDSTSLSLPTMLVHIPEATPFLALFWREVFSATRVFPTPQNQTFPKIK